MSLHKRITGEFWYRAYQTGLLRFCHVCDRSIWFRNHRGHHREQWDLLVNAGIIDTNGRLR